MRQESGAFIYPEAGTEEKDLQSRMLKALSGLGKENEAEELKNEYLQKYPDQTEGIEVLFGIRDLLDLEKEVNVMRGARKEHGVTPEFLQKIKELTEYNYLLTHFIWKNGENREFLEMLWQVFDKISANEKEYTSVKSVRRGIITQVATMKIFEKLGMKPELSKPDEDAFQSIDLWSDPSHAVQVKSGREEEINIVETDEMAPLNIKAGTGGRTDLFTSRHYDAMQNFRLKMDRYKKHEHKPDLKGYFVVLPYSETDPVTGEPSEKLVEALRSKIKTV